MDEYELDKMCEQHPECNCDCMTCLIFAKYYYSNNQ